MTDSAKTVPAGTPPPVPAEGGYQPEAVEAKWQARWAEQRTNEPDLDGARKPFYNLMMFPYPSAEGLHVGNMFAFTGADVFGRFKRLQGYDVFEPIGFDAFGIHSENYAIKVGINPAQLIPKNIANFRRQLHRIGGMFDWRHELSTTDPRYYKWTQWIFLQLLKAGKAYKKAAAVNWCPHDKTVLANEQVINGRCERCDTVVEQRTLEQWFFRITEYADRLLSDLDDKSKMDWSDSTITAQRNWLGRSEGAELEFPLAGNAPSAQPDGADAESAAGDVIRVFTTRPDTVFGATFMVLAPEHPLVDRLTTPGQWREVQAYRTAAAKQDLVSRKVGERDKTGVFTGGSAVNPATGKPIPVWIADYVLMEYGTGAIMAVPGHDDRDFEFATRFKLPIVRVVAEPAGGQGDDPAAAKARAAEAAGGPMEAPYVDNERGVLVNSGRFDRLTVPEAKKAITARLAEQGAGRAVVNYRLHDWCISRQRYWGPPIPVIYCDEHGAVPVPEKDLPVELPIVEHFKPDDTGVSPLARVESWYHAPCPVCGKQGRRETDVSDTFLDSAWYHLRYPSTEFDDRPFDQARTKKWLPVTSYIGGNEHAVLHLLYARFITMVLHELGHVAFDEPYRKFRAHGLIVKDGAKMSKSRGNVVIPDEYINRWGADTFRMYLMFLGPFQEGGDFRDEGISGPRRFLEKVWNLVGDACGTHADDEVHHGTLVKYHQTVKRVTEGMEELRYNTSIAGLMELVNTLRQDSCTQRSLVEGLIVMLAPFAPHFAEESWERLGHDTSVFDARWPEWNAGMVVEDQVEVVVQVSGRTRSRVSVPRGAEQGLVVEAAQRDAAVRRFTEGKEVRKVVYVPNRLLNLVVG
ncbi:MAG TPA: leucine--tRNA ligase [Gemmatimonadales bacterium]|nr:leucine--tRNA ligase [Gemmatimonadales bacterium]